MPKASCEIKDWMQMMHKGTFGGSENIFQLDCGNAYRIIDLLKPLTSIKLDLLIQWGKFYKM